MKRKIVFLSIVFFAGALTFMNSCVKDLLETCEQEEICDDKNVDACCIGDECVYKYNGKEYDADTEIDQLIEDLGCSAKKSTSYEEDMAQIKASLEALLERVKCDQKNI